MVHYFGSVTLVFISSFWFYSYIPYSDGQYVFPGQKLTCTACMAAEIIIRLWRQLRGENAKTTTDLVLGIINILICALKWWGKTVFGTLLWVLIVRSINEFNGMHPKCCVNYPIKKQTEKGRTNTTKDNAAKAREWSLYIKGIFTFTPPPTVC